MSAEFAFYCTCGSSMVGECAPAARVAGLEAAFDSMHTGEGHSRTDQRTARNARRRHDSAERRAFSAKRAGWES